MITISDLIHQDACSPFTLPPPKYLLASASQSAQDYDNDDATRAQGIPRSDSSVPSLTTATTASPSPALAPGTSLPEMSGLALLWAAAVHVENSEAHTTSPAQTGGSSEDQTVPGPAKTTLTVKSTKGRARGPKKRTREDVETDDTADASARPSKRLRRARGFYKE